MRKCWMAALFCVMMGCSQQETLTPTMADSVYQAVLIELHLAAARTEVMDTTLIPLKDSIFAAYDVTEVEYERMTDFLLQHPERHEELLSDALDRLGRERFLENRDKIQN